MTAYSVSPDLCTLEVSGHAGAGEYGRDLVCCAVSTLCAAARLIPWSRWEEGDGHFRITVKEEQRGELRVLIRALRELAGAYPENVCRKEFCYE